MVQQNATLNFAVTTFCVLVFPKNSLNRIGPFPKTFIFIKDIKIR